ncbi:MAG: hypothetical protein LRZ85_06645 [Alphaproteobacteria bacterium]|nr:hypothetical protein [Alphaproteobacteria bacterium]
MRVDTPPPRTSDTPVDVRLEPPPPPPELLETAPRLDAPPPEAGQIVRLQPLPPDLAQTVAPYPEPENIVQTIITRAVFEAVQVQTLPDVTKARRISPYALF